MSDRKTEMKVEATTNLYGKSGELIEAITSAVKMGQSNTLADDMVTIKHGDKSKAEVDYNGANRSSDDSSTTEIDISVRGQVKDLADNKLIDVIASNITLKKSDEGLKADEVSEVWLNLQVEENADSKPKVTTRSHSKLTKADAGRL